MSLSYANSVEKISIKVLIHHVMCLLINYLENDEEHLLLEHVNLASSVTHTHIQILFPRNLFKINYINFLYITPFIRHQHITKGVSKTIERTKLNKLEKEFIATTSTDWLQDLCNATVTRKDFLHFLGKTIFRLEKQNILCYTVTLLIKYLFAKPKW